MVVSGGAVCYTDAMWHRFALTKGADLTLSSQQLDAPDSSEEALVVLKQRESVIITIRWVALMLVLGLGVWLSTLGPTLMLMAIMAGYNLLLWWLNRQVTTIAQQQRLAALALGLDSGFIFAIIAFGITTAHYNLYLNFIFLVIASTYRSGSRGAVASCAIFLFNYTLAWALNAYLYDTPFPTLTVVAHDLFAVGAALMSGLLIRQLNLESRERKQTLDLLLSLANATSLDDALLRAAAQYAARVTGADAAGIFLIDATSGIAQLRAGYNLSDSYLHSRTIPAPPPANVDEPMQRIVVYNGQQSIPAGQREIEQQEGIHALLTVLIIEPDSRKVIGALTVYSRRPDHKFSIPQGTPLLALADSVAGGLAHTRERERLQRRLDSLNALAQSATAVVASTNTEEVLNSILNAAEAHLELHKSTIFLLDEQSKIGTIVSSRGMSDEYVKAINDRKFTPDRDSVAGRAVVDAQPVSVPDLTNDTEFPIVRPLAERYGYRAIVGVPIFADDHVIGALCVYGDQPYQFSVEDERILTLLAGYAGVALRNARLLATVQQQNEQLRELDKLKSSFLARLSHELRTPLATLLAYMEVVEDGSAGPITDTQRHFFKIMRHAGEEQLANIEALLNLVHMEAGALELKLVPVPLYSFLDSVVHEIEPRATHAGIKIELVTPPVSNGSAINALKVCADADRLRQVLLNLMGNAVKFTPEQGEIRVGWHPAEVPGRITLYVCDTGPGIASELLEDIFGSFSQGEDAYRRHYGGLGLGLPISKQIIEKHGGSIKVESKPGAGSTFSFDLLLDTEEDPR